MFDVIMLFYVSLPSWPDINTSCNVARERVSVVRMDHWAETSSHLWRRPSCFSSVISWEKH